MNINLDLTNKTMTLTEQEAEAMIGYYKQLITILEEFQKNPQVIPAYIQACFGAIEKLKNEKSKAEKESTEEANKETNN